jgi:hypothetical protein
VLRHRFGWKRLSVPGALVYEPMPARRSSLVFQLRPGAYNEAFERSPSQNLEHIRVRWGEQRSAHAFLQKELKSVGNAGIGR